MGGQARKDLRVLRLPTRIRIPGKPSAGSPASGTSCRRARVRHAGSVAGRRRAGRCGARLCIPVGPQAGGIVRISSACGSVRGARQACSRRARVGKTSRTHQVQSPGTHRARPGAHSELRRHGCSHREPRRTRSAGVSPKLPSLLKKGLQVQSRKKIPPRFSLKKTKPKRYQSPPLRPPGPLLGSFGSSSPAGQRINTHK